MCRYRSTYNRLVRKPFQHATFTHLHLLYATDSSGTLDLTLRLNDVTTTFT
jgi:hypothetical protein